MQFYVHRMYIKPIIFPHRVYTYINKAIAYLVLYKGCYLYAPKTDICGYDQWFPFWNFEIFTCSYDVY